jgi:hypothetical protein
MNRFSSLSSALAVGQTRRALAPASSILVELSVSVTHLPAESKSPNAAQ